MGRVRPVPLFVEQCLLDFDNIDFEVNKYFHNYFNILTKPSRSQWSLSHLFEETRFSKMDYLQVMEILKKAVYFQLCFGFPYIISDASDARLFEYAFGILLEEPESKVFEMKVPSMSLSSSKRPIMCFRKSMTF